MKPRNTFAAGVAAFASLASAACAHFDPAAAGGGAVGTAADPSVPPTLPPEPKIPPPCATLVATKKAVNTFLPVAEESTQDTERIQAALNACTPGYSVQLKSDGAANGFLSGPLTLNSGITLWIDANTTLFASRNPRDYDIGPGTCGTDDHDDSGGCKALINVNQVSDVGVMGAGAIDGRGGELMIGSTQTWWDVAQHAKKANRKHSNPRLIEVKKTRNFMLYKVSIYDSPKFHVVIGASGYMVWGVTVLTPSHATNSVGTKLTPYYARNTDGIDPSGASNGFIVYSYISVGDDQIAIKAGGTGPINNLIIAHNHFGTGHGMSIGSETNSGVKRVTVYDLSIDGSIDSGGMPKGDLNGIRIKSDSSRGGPVTDITYTDVCVRDMINSILISPHYSKSTGGLIPEYERIVLNNVRAFNDPARTPVVTLMGYDEKNMLDVTLNNVIVEGIVPDNVKAAYANIKLGAGPVNFTATGNKVSVINNVKNNVPPNPCTDKFVKFPTRQ